MGTNTTTPPVGLGSPAGLTVTSLIGAAHVGDYVTIFGLCSDGAVWGRAYYQTQWLAWVKIGSPLAGLSATGNDGANGAVSAGGSCWLFALGKDGAVSTALAGAGAAQWVWVAAPGLPPGVKVTGILGATMKPLAVYVRGSDGAVWCAVWSGAIWVWAKQSAAPTIFYAKPTLCWDHTATAVDWSGVGNLFLQIGVNIGAALAVSFAGQGGAGDLPFQTLDTDGTTKKTYTSIFIEFTLANGVVSCTVQGVG